MPLRPNEAGFKYVYVENDGNVRELNIEEQNYLAKKFLPNDSNRPFIKMQYSELTPDGRISGFIERKRVPSKIIIK